MVGNEVKYMSTIIAVCGNNFCTLVADKRKTTYNESGPCIEDDNFDKIFKINDRVLFGVTGIMWEKDILEPLNIYPDKSIITLRQTYKAALEYLDKKFVQTKSKTPRNYIVAGKDNKGIFTIYKLHYDIYECKIETEIYSASNGIFGIAFAAPEGFSPENISKAIKKIELSVQNSTTHESLVGYLSEVIKQISDVNPTVGKNISVLNIY